MKPIKLSKAGIPLGVFTQSGLSKTVKDSDVNESEEEQMDVPRNTVRHKDETKDEKKQRKQEVKNDRKVSSSICQLGYIRSRVRLRPICMQLVAGFLLFRHCKSFQKYRNKLLL